MCMHAAAWPPRCARCRGGSGKDKPSDPRATCMPALTRLACGTGASVALRLLLACKVQQPCSSQPAPRWPPRGSAAAHAEGSPGPRRPSIRRPSSPPSCHIARRRSCWQQLLGILLLLLPPSCHQEMFRAASRCAAAANSAAAARALAPAADSPRALAALEYQPHAGKRAG